MQPENIATLQGNPIARLKDGQSVFIESSRDGMENTYRELKLKCLDYSTFHGGKFEVRKVVGGIRVWRLKPEDAPARIERKKVAPPPPITRKENELPKPKLSKKEPAEKKFDTGKTGKKCARCGEVKPLDGFNKHSKAKDGLQVYCRECSRANSREYAESKRLRSVVKGSVKTDKKETTVVELVKKGEKIGEASYTVTAPQPLLVEDKRKTRRIPVPYIKPEPVAVTFWTRLKKIVGL